LRGRMAGSRSLSASLTTMNSRSKATETPTVRERALRVLRYEPCDRLPLVHFGFWKELYDKWEAEGHIPTAPERECLGGGSGERMVAEKLGFETGWGPNISVDCFLHPAFEPEVVRELPDGSRHRRQADGVVVLEQPGAISIPAEIDHLLKDRASWEEHYRPRLEWSPERLSAAKVLTQEGWIPFFEGGREYLAREDRPDLAGLWVGSLIGWARNWFGIVELSYQLADDPDLVREVIDVVGSLQLRCLQEFFAAGGTVDHLHFWEDISYNMGPLVNPAFIREACGPWYKAIADEGARHGVDLVSLDSDGCIDALVPVWLENGVNIMFPIEVGTWKASLAPWREQYGREVRGIGGVNKTIFSRDRAAIDREIERLKPLVALGGYLPCPDHRIPLEAEWDLVRYYCDRMRETFGGS
jgi:hypothetical protein